MKRKEKAYIKVYEHIKKKIINGSYEYGSKIPSKRETSEDENVSLITVEHAYELLLEEGYIISKLRSGYFVSYKVGDIFESDTHEETIILPKSKDEPFPISVFSKACRKVLSEMESQLPSRSEGKGNLQLRKAIASYLSRTRDIKVKPSQIIIGAGSEYLYSLVIDLLGRDKVYGIEDPAYEKIYDIYKSGGVEVERLKLGNNGIKTSELKKTKASILHVTPYHSFPSGSTTDASKRREYIDWVNKKHKYIVEDDYESEFTPSIKAEETLYSLDHKHVIYMNTFTKTISSSIRVGYMILPEELVDKYEKTQSFRSCTVSEFIQLVITELLNNGSFERNLNRIRRKRNKRQ